MTKLATIEIIKKNVMGAAPRIFGETLGEKILIELFDELSPKKKGDSKHFDAREDYLEAADTFLKAEIKLSRAKVQVKGDVIDKMMSPLSNTFVKFNSNEPFLCNMQQVKTDQFDAIYYGIFFDDDIMIFKTTPIVILNDKNIRYSDKQHKGNVGEGQFHIDRSNIQYHMDNFLIKKIKWKDVVDVLKK